MTDYALRTLDATKAVRQAAARVEAWDAMTRQGVSEQMPQVARKAGHEDRDWWTTVESLRRDWETPVMAAERVALWVALHAETYGRPPTQRALQNHATTEESNPRRDRHAW